jgi:mannose-6-phosphate isomerase
VNVPRIIPLAGAVRDYAWGSPTAIPRLLGVPPTGAPAAELWLGAHPDEPSRWAGHPDEPPLDALIAADPHRLLGEPTVAEFGPRLPFLLKVLAADKALSMQVHPDTEQARSGFAAEEAGGIARSDPERNYRDPHHKPELACALTDFEAFCGFRPAAGTLELLAELAVPELDGYTGRLREPSGVRDTFTDLLTLAEPDRASLISAVQAGCRRLAATTSPWADTARACLTAAADFPGDIGAVLALLLNHVRLAPGEAIFLGAGNVHAYLRGMCVEILASSDNVLRCGLTPKYIDVAELLRIADFGPLAEPRWPARDEPPARVYAVPVTDFRLAAVDLGGAGPATAPTAVDLDPGLPCIALCVSGEASVAAAGIEVRLEPGRSAFVSAGDEPVRLTGSGQIFLATPGL